MAMDVTVVNSAQGHRELVADLETHRPRLGKSEVMGVNGVSAADQARTRRHEFEVGFVAQPTGLADCKYTFVDLRGSVVANMC
jgi:hypothetical protein